MPANSRKLWSDADLASLQELVRLRTPVDAIVRTLGRTEPAIRHALIKVLFRSMIHYPSDDLFAYYRLNPDNAPRYFVQDKYDRPPNAGNEYPGESCGKWMCRVTSGMLVTSSIALLAAVMLNPASFT